MKNLALFDFDGTLTTKDTLLEFLKFYKGQTNFYIGLLRLGPAMFLYKLGLIPNWRAKEIMLEYFLGNQTLDDIMQFGHRFALTRIPSLIRREAIDRLNYHREQGDEIVIVSASPELWIGPYCDSIQVKYVATRLKVEKGKLTGRLDGKNCYGAEKVSRVMAFLDIKNFESISAYGDSRGDREMLALAHNRYYRRFN